MSDLLQEIGARIAAECAEAYFVGGCVRDHLRNEPLKDIDVALSGNTHAIGRKLARDYQGHVFWLHEDEGVVRVVLPKQDGLQIDICPLRGSLDDDLRARDLTINAMAIATPHGLDRDAPILDPMGGRADLESRLVRFCTSASPESDPLRTLRALRFRWKLGFDLAEGTADRIRECVPMLARVSVERVRDELFQLLSIDNADHALAETLEFGAGRWLIGRELVVGVDQGCQVAVERVAWLLGFLRQAPDELTQLLAVEPTPPRRRREVLLWGAVLQALEPSVAPGAAARYLALSNDEKQLITKGVEGARRVTVLLADWPAEGRARYRHFRAAGPAAPETVILAGAAAGDWTAWHAELLQEALDRVLRPAPALLTGSDIMRLLDLGPGPRVGELINGIEEARADGLLTSAAEAEAWLRLQAH